MRTSATLAILLVTAGCYAEIPERAKYGGLFPARRPDRWKGGFSGDAVLGLP
jgi:hypothetical protein